jgi:hypothetical protein
MWAVVARTCLAPLGHFFVGGAWGYRDLWLKVKCLHREEFVVVGWTDPSPCSNNQL